MGTAADVLATIVLDDIPQLGKEILMFRNLEYVILHPRSLLIVCLKYEYLDKILMFVNNL